MMRTSPTRTTGIMWAGMGGLLVWWADGPVWSVIGTGIICFAAGNIMEMVDELLRPRDQA